MSFRTVKRVIPQQHTHWVGDGFKVFPVFGSLAFTNEISPWLMFDYAAPKQFPPTTSQLGVGKHPHRGFETITIAWQGEVEHADSVGNSGVIEPGDVQWMTAGRGIVHEEYHSRNFARKGGVFEMCQLWLNLPAKDKMSPPRYQPIKKDDIPVFELGEGVAQVSVIAGKLGTAKGPAMTFSPVELWDVIVDKAGVPVELEVPEKHNVQIFVRKGGVMIGDMELGPQSVALMNGEKGNLSFTAISEGTQVLVMGGEPLNEPIANRGPFVMNTQDELRQAVIDYSSGKMGR